MSVSNGPLDTQPLSWIGRVPVYATTILAAITVGFAVFIVFLMTFRVDPNFLLFHPVDFWTQFKFWQLVTHPLLNVLPDVKGTFFYLIAVVFLHWAGTEVEKFVGRKVWAKMVLIICVAPALASTVWWLFGSVIPVGGIDVLWIGLLVAFATIYPNVDIFFNIPAKWYAAAVIAIGTLMHFPAHAWGALSIFLFSCACIHLYTRYELGHWSLPDFELPSISFKKSPKFHVVPKIDSMDTLESELEPELDQEVNTILDKIAKSGIGSLTAEERDTLQRAREELIKKESH